MAVTFVSSDHCSHVLLRVRHLANGVVVFLESRVFSSLGSYCIIVLPYGVRPPPKTFLSFNSFRTSIINNPGYQKL